MTDNEIRLKIAELKGYTFWDSPDKLGPWTRRGNPSSASYAGGIPLYKVDDPNPNSINWDDDYDPNWPADIAAAWELEESIPEDQRVKYGNELARIVARDLDTFSNWDLIHATARQRCLAWLKWKGVDSDQ